MLAVWQHGNEKFQFLMMFGGFGTPSQIMENKPVTPDGLAREEVLLHTARYQVPGSQVSWHQDTRKAGILASWQLGMGMLALQEAKMCTEAPKLSILGCQNVDNLVTLVT